MHYRGVAGLGWGWGGTFSRDGVLSMEGEAYPWGFDFGPYLVDGQGVSIYGGGWSKGPVTGETIGVPILFRAFFKGI